MHRSKMLVLLGVSMLLSSLSKADTLTGTYVAGGATTGTGPWTLTSTDTTFSLLRFDPNQIVKFSDLSNVSVDFDSISGGGGGGAPRLQFFLDINSDNVSDGRIEAHLGTSPTFIDSSASLDLLSGTNLLNNDPGRFDLSFAPTPGSPFTTLSAALTAWGNANVLRYRVVLDSFGGADKTLQVNSINVQAVPVPMALYLGGSLLGVVVFGKKLRRPTAVA